MIGAGGPVIVGSADHADVLRLEGFLARNGHPHQRLDPKTDPCAQTLIERFHIDASRIADRSLSRMDSCCAIPSEVELARCIGLVEPIDPDKIYDVVIVGAGPAGLAAAVYAASEGCRCSCWIAALSAARPARRRASRTIWAFRPASPAWP